MGYRVLPPLWLTNAELKQWNKHQFRGENILVAACALAELAVVYRADGRGIAVNPAPYLALHWGYRGAGGGVDCWQLVCRVAREQFGREYPDPFTVIEADYPPVMDAERERWAKVDPPEPGDVVLITLGGLPMHVGIMLDGRRFLHILKDQLASVGEVDSIIWKSRIAGYYRLEVEILEEMKDLGSLLRGAYAKSAFDR